MKSATKPGGKDGAFREAAPSTPTFWGAPLEQPGTALSKMTSRTTHRATPSQVMRTPEGARWVGSVAIGVYGADVIPFAERQSRRVSTPVNGGRCARPPSAMCPKMRIVSWARALEVHERCATRCSHCGERRHHRTHILLDKKAKRARGNRKKIHGIGDCIHPPRSALDFTKRHLYGRSAPTSYSLALGVHYVADGGKLDSSRVLQGWVVPIFDS